MVITDAKFPIKMSDYVGNIDDYLIPGVGLRFDLLLKYTNSKSIPVGYNQSASTLNKDVDVSKSVDNMRSNETHTINKDRQSFDRLSGFTHCQIHNGVELKGNKMTTISDNKLGGTDHLDSLAWSVDTVTVKSGKHRTNRTSSLNKDGIIVLQSLNTSNSVKNNIIANRNRSLQCGQTPPTHHPYSFNSTNSNNVPGRRISGPCRLKPIAYSKLPDKATTGCADLCLKGHNVNKQMANVNAGILTASPARDDRWEEDNTTRGLMKQTTVSHDLRRETVASQELFNTMEKKKMMKRQCMYFPLVDDYVMLTPNGPHADHNDASPSLRVKDRKIIQKVTSEDGSSYNKQFSPVTTVSSGYESDYSPPWPSEMEPALARMLGSVGSNQDDSHTDYFSQSETYPKSSDEQDQLTLNPMCAAPGRENQQADKISEGKSSDGYPDSSSRSNFVAREKLVLANEHCQNNSDSSHKSSSITSEPHTTQQCKISFEKYLLSDNKRNSTGCFHQAHRAQNGSTTSLNVSALVSDRLRDSDSGGSVSSLKPRGNCARRNKRYRYDTNHDSSCKLKPVNISDTAKSKPLGEFEMQSTCPNTIPSRITPVDFFGLFRKSPAIGQSSTENNHPIQTIGSNNGLHIQIKNVSFEDEQLKKNLSHGRENCVGYLEIDNTCSVTRNAHNLGCAKSPRGKYDNDNEHIYDVIPGDENVIISPTKHLPPMASNLIRSKWTTLQDIRRPKDVTAEDPPALPTRSYLKDKGNNSVNSMSSARFVYSSVDDLYARVQKKDSITEHLYTSPLKVHPPIFDISSKENAFALSTKPKYFDDYEDLSSETYCRIGSTIGENVSCWSSGDVLNFIDGIEQPEAKRRDNIYGLLVSRQTRAKLSESLEIEHKLVNMGLLRNTWSCDATEVEEKPPEIPPRIPLNTLRPIYV